MIRLLKRSALGREDGQVLLIVASALVLLVGIAGLVVDGARVWIAQRQLQQAVDAAALVAGQNMPNATKGYTAAVAFSGGVGGKNVPNGYGVTAAAPTVKYRCVSTAPGYNAGPPVSCPADQSNTNCHPAGSAVPDATTCNAVTVKETATVDTTFAHLFLPRFTVQASATVAARGGVPHPLDVAIVFDTTGSMNTNCGDAVKDINTNNTIITAANATKMDCAKDGVRRLISALLPCDESLQSCTGAPAVDNVGIFVFPELTQGLNYVHDTHTSPIFNDVNLEIGCEGGLATAPFWYKTSGGAQKDEVQTVTVSGATFTLTYGGQTTASLTKATTTAANLQTALQGLSSIGFSNAAVTGATGGPYTVTFVGDLGNTNVAQMTATNATVATPTAGGAFQPNPAFPNAWYLDNGDVGYGSGTYQVISFTNDYKTDDTSGLNTQSQLVQSVSWGGCGPNGTGTYPGNEYYGINAPNHNTYYAGAIQAAQNALQANANLDPTRHAQPVIIFLSDGDSNSGDAGTGNLQCHAAITNATNAASSSLWTWIYSIAYVASTSSGNSCSTDRSAGQPISGFETMRQIARDNQLAGNNPDSTKFFCVGVASPPSPCQSNSSLAAVFASIGVDLTSSRLVSDPNNPSG